MGLPDNGGADEGPCFYGNTVPLEDTLPLGDEDIDKLETQLLGDAPNLDGETQLLEDPESVANDETLGRNDNPVRTQPMEEYEETQVVEDDDGDEGTDQTILLSDDGGLSDDAATPCRVRRGSDRVGAEDGSKVGTRTLPPAPCLPEKGKREIPVDSEASAGEEGGSGPLRRRSFAEVRAASLRASGLAAACSMAPQTAISEESPTFCNGQSRVYQDDISVAEHNIRSSEEDVSLAAKREEFVDSRAGGLSPDLGIENSEKFMQRGCTEETTNRSGSLAVRKLTFEEAISGKDESTSKMIDDGNTDRPHSLVYDCSSAGLSYVGSQEPGQQSQADAFNAIDKFLSINDVGFSQEANTGEASGARTPPVSSAKGAHCLVKRVGLSSPVGKAGIFDWVDTLEDEGGGDFFSKRKDLFFGKSDPLKKSYTKSLKSRHCVSRLARDAFDKIGKNDGPSTVTTLGTVGLTLSESRLKLHNDACDELGASQMKTSRILYKEIVGQLNEDPRMQQLQETDGGRSEETTWDIGPDTQMAAEAMETLVFGPSADHALRNAHPDSGKTVEGPKKHATRKKGSSQCISSKERGASASDLGGNIRRSKRIKMLHVETSLYGPDSSKESMKSSKIKANLTEKASMECEHGKTEELVCMVKCISEHKLLNGTSHEAFRSGKLQRKSRCGTSVMTGEVGKEVVESGTKEADEPGGLFSKELAQRVNNLIVTPIAHRTRKSKVNAAERLEMLSTDHDQTTKDLEARTVPMKRKQRGVVADAPEQLSDLGKTSNQVEFDAQKIAMPTEKSCRNDSLLVCTVTHRKRRTPHRSKSRNAQQAVNMEGRPLSMHVLPKATSPGPKQDHLNMVAENGDASQKHLKNKSRKDVALLPPETDVVHGSVTRPLVGSGVRTRSFIKSHPNTSAEDATQGLKADISAEAGSSYATHSSATVNEKVPRQEVEPALFLSFACSDVEHDTQLCDVPDEQVNVKDRGTLKERVQLPGSTPTTLQNKLSTGSPVCTSLDPLKASRRKGLSRSLVARELAGLESMEAASILESKDLRRRRNITSVRVCLSHHLDDDIIKHQKKLLARFGVPIVASVSDATHFIADEFVRTRNMLEAMATGKPVVTHLWLESCGQASCFIDEKNYILRDAKKEKEIGFNMPASLARAHQMPLLQGKRVLITQNVKPHRELVADLVRAAQGQPLERVGRSAMKGDKVPDDLLVISCEEDFAACMPLLEKGAEVFSSELLLNGIVTQKLEYERHRLFLDHVKRTRSTIWLRKGNDSHFLPITKSA